MSNLHQSIVNDNGVVVGWESVGANENRIADHITRELHLSVYDVLKADRTLADVQANHGRSTIARRVGNLLLSKPKASSRILPCDTLQLGLLSLSRQFLFGTEAVIGFFGFNEFS